MCHRHRHRRQCAPRRTPVLILLGQKALSKYQERKQVRNDTARAPSPTPEQMELSANAEVLEKAGIAPPRYSDVVTVGNKNINVEEKEKQPLPAYREGREEDDDLSDDEEFYEVVDGRRVMNGDLVAAQSEFVRKWKGRKAAA